MRKLVFSVILSLILGCAAASAHEQSAIVGGKRIQPTKKSFEQRRKEHEIRSSQGQRDTSKRSGLR